MEAVFYSFNKRRNSTKQPTGGTTIDVNLKAVTDMRSPILVLSYEGIPAFNYFSLNGKYFWIDSIESIRDNVWAIHGRIDVLASYKNAIQGSSAYVLYDTTANTEIVDSRIPIKKSVQTSRSFTNLNPEARINGTYIITTQSYEHGCQSYIIGYSYLVQLLKRLEAWTESYIDADAVDIMENIFGILRVIGRLLVGSGNIIDNIKSIIFIPFNISGEGELEEIAMGAFSISGVYGRPIGSEVQSNSVQLSIPWIASDWRRKAPYTQLNLYLPFVGNVALSSDQLASESNITIITSVNKLTGAVSYQVSMGSDTGRVIGVYGGNAGYMMPFGFNVKTIGDVINSIGQLATGAIAAASGNYAAIGSIVSATRDMITPTTATVGGASGGAGVGLSLAASMLCTYHDTIAEPSTYSAIQGTPSMVVKSLSGLTGFVQTANFSLAAEGYAADIEEVNSMMNGGVYIE